MQFIPKSTKTKPIFREKIVIYLDLTTKILKKKKLVKALNHYIIRKFNENPHQVFEVFYFNHKNEPKIFDNLNTPKQVLQIIEEAWKARLDSNSFFENGLFFCLSGIASSFLSESIIFRILVISDLPSIKNSNYTEALMNLVETVSFFPTYIDIIRIGHQDRYSDDVKLNLICEITKGKLYYIHDYSELVEALTDLIEIRNLPSVNTKLIQEIKEYNEYYEDLAIPLTNSFPSMELFPKCKICENSICQYCYSDEDQLKYCPSCGYSVHECCGALYSWNFNIGIKNIFRCPDCGILLKLNKELVYKINGESVIEENNNKNLTNIPIIKPKNDFIDDSIQKEQKFDILSLEREKKNYRQRRTMICPVCSSFLKKDEKKCPKCGCPIRDSNMN